MSLLRPISVMGVESITMFCFFFFSSRRRHTRLQGDWSSDVCSSDLSLLLHSWIRWRWVAEPDLPVGAVAKRLVLRSAAAAQRVMLFRCALAEGHAEQLYPAGDRVGPVVGHRNRRLAFLVAVLDVLYRVAQRTRRAFLDRLDDLLGACAIGVDPGLCAHPEDRLQAVGAEAGVGADAAIVVDGNALAGIALAAVRSRAGAPLVLEPDQAV